MDDIRPFRILQLPMRNSWHVISFSQTRIYDRIIYSILYTTFFFLFFLSMDRELVRGSKLIIKAPSDKSNWCIMNHIRSGNCISIYKVGKQKRTFYIADGEGSNHWQCTMNTMVIWGQYPWTKLNPDKKIFFLDNPVLILQIQSSFV